MHFLLFQMAEQQKKYQESMEVKMREQEKKIKQLKDENFELQGELSVYNDGQEITTSDMKKLEISLHQSTKELQDTKKELESVKSEVKILQENLAASEEKYIREMMLHSEDIQTLTTVKEELAKTVAEIANAKQARDEANIVLQESRESWSKQADLFKKEKVEIERRFRDLDSQNSMLLDQLQELNTCLSLKQAQASGDFHNTSLGNISSNKSFGEDDTNSPEQLLKVIKYLRQEKDIAISKADILEAEHTRIKSQYDSVIKELEDAKSSLEMEKQKSDVSVITAAKHAEVLRKVETLNAITDSNRTLRMERDSLLTQFNELKQKTSAIEEQLLPLQEKNRELTLKAEALQAENVTLRGEATRWRQRANILIEKSNRTSPEDWKKLQNERESLAKQLTVERANNTQLNIDFNQLTKEKAKLEEQLKDQRMQHAHLKEGLDKTNEELTSVKTQLNTLLSDLEQSRSENVRIAEEQRDLTDDVAAKDVTITELKNNLAQIRKIAKKYKQQCEEQVKEIEQLRQLNEIKDNMEVPLEKQEQFRQEGREESEERVSQMERSHQIKLNEVAQQISVVTEENDNYKKEIENLRQTNMEKEERFKTLFKNAKDRIVTLTEQNTTLKTELDNQERQNRTDGQGDINRNEELEKLKKEKEDILTEKQAEKERLTQEIETLMQRVNQLQRQLGLQQGSKPSTSSGSTEKSTTEPPTANIKPMSGNCFYY